MSKLIVLEQKPIIQYSQMEERGKEVAEKISLMNIDTIDATEESRALMKKMRAELNKELEIFESQRKMIHGAINQPYKEFTDSYEKNIKALYKEAASSLKSKIDSVENKMLLKKRSDINAYFKSICDLDFITIDDADINIIMSASKKKLCGQIDDFVEGVKKDLTVISQMDDNVRIESLYKTNLDLSQSVRTVREDIKREQDLEERKEKEAKEAKEREAKRIEAERIRQEQEAKDMEERKRNELEALERKRIQAEKNAALNKTKEADDEAKRIEVEKEQVEQELIRAEQESTRIQKEKEALDKEKQEASKTHKMTFIVSGNMGQLKQIKSFLDEIGVEYE